jgi:hypothetical protein
LELSSGSRCGNSSIRIGSVGAGISSVGIWVSSSVSGVSGIGDLRSGCVGNSLDRCSNRCRCSNGVNIGSGNWGRCSNGVNVGSGNWSRCSNSVNIRNSGNISVNVSLRGNLGVNVRLSSDISMNVGLSFDFGVNVGFSLNVLMNIRDSFNFFMNIGLGSNLFMNIRDSFDIFMNIGLGSNLSVDVGFSEGVKLASVVIGVHGNGCRGNSKRGRGISGDVSVSCRCSSIGSGVCRVSSRDSCVWVSSISSITIVWEGGDDSGVSFGGGASHSQESRKSDKSLHFEYELLLCFRVHN